MEIHRRRRRRRAEEGRREKIEYTLVHEHNKYIIFLLIINKLYNFIYIINIVAWGTHHLHLNLLMKVRKLWRVGGSPFTSRLWFWIVKISVCFRREIVKIWITVSY